MITGISEIILHSSTPPWTPPIPGSKEKRHQHIFYARKHQTRYWVMEKPKRNFWPTLYTLIWQLELHEIVTFLIFLSRASVRQILLSQFAEKEPTPRKVKQPLQGHTTQPCKSKSSGARLIPLTTHTHTSVLQKGCLLEMIHCSKIRKMILVCVLEASWYPALR